MGHSHGRKWTDDDVRKELRAIANSTNVMPTANELRCAGRNDLAMQISRRGGFVHWAKQLGLATRNSQTSMGQRWEDHVCSLLKQHGHSVERQTTKARFDILVDDRVRVNVKSAHWNTYGACKGFFFGIGDTWASCDLFALVPIESDDRLPRVLWVPWHEARQQTIALSRSHRLNAFTDISIVRVAANGPMFSRTG